jgi:hypothetical protein
VFSFLKLRTLNKVQNPLILNVMHHRQNPFESNQATLSPKNYHLWAQINQQPEFHFTGVKELDVQWCGLVQVAGRPHPSSATGIVASNPLTYKSDVSFTDFAYAIISPTASAV